MGGMRLVAVAAVTAFAGTAASAQTASTDPSGTDSPTRFQGTEKAQLRPETSGQHIGEIIVTAQRRNENLQRVPVSVTALTSGTLASRNLNDISQIVLAAPSLQIGVFGNFSVRGVGTITNSDTVDTSVAVAVDEVNLGRPNLAVDLFNDVQQVEVLNGPQGLLFGRNASAGLLNIVTNRPVLGKLQNIFSFEAGSLDKPGGGDAASIILRETINIPVTSRSALRLNGFYSFGEPPITHVGVSTARQDLNERKFGVRVKYLAELSDNLKLYVIGEYAESHGGFANTTFRAIGGPQSLIGAQLAADGIAAGPNNFLLSGAGPYFNDIKNWGVQAKLSYDFEKGLELSNIAAYKNLDSDHQFDTDFVSTNGLDINEDHSKYHQFSDELRLALPSGNRLSGQVGLYFFEAHNISQQDTGGDFFIPSGALPFAPFCVGAGATPGCATRNLFAIGRDVHYRLLNRSYAAFGQFTYEITHGLTLTAGARVTRDQLTINQRQNQNNYFIPLGVPATFDQSTANTNLSWKGGVQYEILPTMMAYATYGRGYKGPGSNDSGATPTSNLIVQPETSNNIEVGIKSTFFDRRLVFNISAFHTKFSNYQSESFDAGVTTFVIQNAASLTSKGAELTIIANPVKGFTLNGTAAFLDSKFDSFPGAQCYPGQPTSGCSTVGAFDASGFRTPAAPRFTSSIQAIYEAPIGNGVNAFIEASYYHRSSINYQINAAPGSAVPAIDIVGGSLGIHLDHGARLAVFCKNCTNVKYPIFVLSDPVDATVNAPTFDQAFGPDSVRTIGISGTFEF